MAESQCCVREMGPTTYSAPPFFYRTDRTNIFFFLRKQEFRDISQSCFFWFLFLLLMVLLLLRGYHELKPTRCGAFFGKDTCVTSHEYRVHHQLATMILSSKMAAVSLLSSIAYLVALMVTGVRRHMRASLKKKLQQAKRYSYPLVGCFLL